MDFLLEFKILFTTLVLSSKRTESADLADFSVFKISISFKFPILISLDLILQLLSDYCVFYDLTAVILLFLSSTVPNL